VLRKAVAKSPGRAAFVNTWQMLTAPGGRYADYLRDPQGKLVQMRAPDGVHYTSAAGDLIARSILAELGKVYDLRR
jgi:hypothetical protein